MTEIRIVDAHEVMQQPPQPMAWAVDGLFPMGAVVDVFGPPGAGKTTLVTDLALAFAGGAGKWHGHDCIDGPVAVLGGERTDRAAIARDLHRTQRPAPPQGDLVFPLDHDDDCPPIWRWNKRADDGAGCWALTDWGDQITNWLVNARPVLVIIDTVLSAAQGCDLLDPAQQYALGQTIRRWSKLVDPALTLTISHTNQASSNADLKDRLDYLSRAGGNGFPGSLRTLAGLTRVRDGEVPGFDPADDETLFAFGLSKHNESPRPDWTHHAPAIFSQRSGRLELVADGVEVRKRIEKGAATPRSSPKAAASNASNANVYLAAKNGAVQAKNVGGDDDWQ
jgi:hypothetical protein